MTTQFCKIRNISPSMLIANNEKQQKQQNWNEKLSMWNKMLKDLGKAASYAIHR